MKAKAESRFQCEEKMEKPKKTENEPSSEKQTQKNKKKPLEKLKKPVSAFSTSQNTP